MPAPAMQPPRCRACTAILEPPGHVCASCNTVQQVSPVQTAYNPGVSAKSPGLAVLLTFFWLGAGHLYVGSIGIGIGLLIYDMLLWIFSWTLVGLVLTIPLWLISAPIAMVFAARAANAFNERNGIVVR